MALTNGALALANIQAVELPQAKRGFHPSNINELRCICAGVREMLDIDDPLQADVRIGLRVTPKLAERLTDRYNLSWRLWGPGLEAARIYGEPQDREKADAPPVDDEHDERDELDDEEEDEIQKRTPCIELLITRERQYGNGNGCEVAE